MEPVGDYVLASFRTALAPTDPFLGDLAWGTPARGAVQTHLGRSPSRLRRSVGDDAWVGPGERGLTKASRGPKHSSRRREPFFTTIVGKGPEPARDPVA